MPGRLDDTVLGGKKKGMEKTVQLKNEAASHVNIVVGMREWWGKKCLRKEESIPTPEGKKVMGGQIIVVFGLGFQLVTPWFPLNWRKKGWGCHLEKNATSVSTDKKTSKMGKKKGLRFGDVPPLSCAKRRGYENTKRNAKWWDSLVVKPWGGTSSTLVGRGGS